MKLSECINHHFLQSNPAGTRPEQTNQQNDRQYNNRFRGQGFSSPDAFVPHMTSQQRADYDNSNTWKSDATLSKQIANPTVVDSLKPNLTTIKKAKTPISSLYNVSSNEEDDDDEENDNVPLGECDADERIERLPDETPAQFSRRSLRIRRSQQKAKASLPPDFVDRIEAAPVMTESVYNEIKGVHQDAFAIRGSGSDECDEVAQSEMPDSSKRKTSKPYLTESTSNNRLGQGNNPNQPLFTMVQSGVIWNTGDPQSLETLMSHFRSKPAGTTFLVQAIAQRPNCRCALCGHESLLLFPVLDASVALAHWGSWCPVAKSHSRLKHSRQSNRPTLTTEIHASLVLFRQCRGWYEILNEDFQPIPHLTTMEQMRRTMPSTFLIRKDLRCLIAPPSLTIPITKEGRLNVDDASLSSNLIATASSPEVIMNSTADILPAGSLMRTITYLPRCVVKRGHKTKDLGLLLATYRSPEHMTPRSSSLVSSATPGRAYYIGLEDSTPAILPPRFSISPVAGPENISGVHSLASILRKFCLPITIRPVVIPDATNDDRSSISGISGLNCGLSAIAGLNYTDQSYLRLESLRRSDLLIIAPSSSPDRLYLITPTMLPDHLFQVGDSEDSTYLKLLEGHRVKSTNFLAVAHPKESLNYLVRHMKDVTREPRQSYTNRRKKSTMSQPQLTTSEANHIYDELDDIYYYIRHGYYPAKSRPSEDSPKYETTENMVKHSESPTHFERTRKMTPDNCNPQRPSCVPNAEALLAASLVKPIRNLNIASNLHNGASQPKEQGI